MSVRASPISKTAAVLIIVIGAFVLFTGIVAGDLANDVAGGSFVVLGVVLYVALLRFARRLRAEVSESAG